MMKSCLLLSVFFCSAAFAGDPPPTPCPAIPGSAGLIEPGSVLLLGELHGTNESPAFVAALACHAVAAGTELVVGLELLESIQSDVNRYLQSPGSEDDRKRLIATNLWQREYQDGRNSRAMLRLIDDLRQLRDDAHPLHVLTFDSGGPGQQRERGMAANIVASARARPESLHIVLSGNLHTRVTRGARRNADYEPMGYVIRNALPSRKVASLDADHAGGTAWVCAPDCGMVTVSGEAHVPNRTIEIDEATRPAGHAGWYGVGRITASPPASGTFCRNQFEALLPTLDGDYRAFDQTMGEGWRRLGKVECLAEGVALIGRYLEKHPDLTAGEQRILHFHAGQLLARDARAAAAIAQFEQAIDPDEARDASFRWNAYVQATIAFLRNDKDGLLAWREGVAASTPRGGQVPNLAVVDRLIAGFGQGYGAAYAGPPAPTREPAPLPAVSTPAIAEEAPATRASSAGGEVEKWQGFWQAYEYGARAWTIRIDGDSFHGVLGEDDWYQGRIEIRDQTSPAEIDFHIEECRCSYQGQASEGIFQWSGESILLAAPQPGASRPTVFDENSGNLVELKKIEE